VKGLKELDIKNISLIGFMGSGKSTVGKILAEKLNFLFIDTDKIIELSENRSIPEIFEQDGENFFRDVESEVISKVYPDNRNCIFSCGGGVVLREDNMQIIKAESFVIYLHITPGIAYERLKNVNDRPLLDKKDRQSTIRKLIDFRKELYLKYCDLMIENKDKKPEMVAEEVLESIKIHKKLSTT
jgi:shikimate dehydrogenase